MRGAETDLEAEVDPSVETEEKLRAEEEAARQRLEAMQRLVICTSEIVHDCVRTCMLIVVTAGKHCADCC